MLARLFQFRKKDKRRPGSPTHSAGSLLQTNSAPAGLLAPDRCDGAAHGSAASAAQQHNGAAAAANGAAPADGAAASGTAPAPHQQRLDELAATHRRSSSDGMLAAVSGAGEELGDGAARQHQRQQHCPAPLPAGVLRSGSGSSGSRRASLLSDSGRASRRSSLQQGGDAPASAEQDGALPEQQRQQQAAPPHPCVSQLPLHLLQQPPAGSAPPSVAPQQQQQQQQDQLQQDGALRSASADAPGAPSPDPQQQQGAAAAPGGPPAAAAGAAWSFGMHSERNQRAAMEDRSQAVNLTGRAEFPGSARAGFFAVFDGHAGHETAQYLADHMLGYVLARGPAALAHDPLAALGDAVQRAERELVASNRCAGSTLCALLMVDDKLHVAHVGDSRAVLGRGGEARQLTRDHKPACELEAARVAADDPAAEITSDGYMYGEIAVTRAIGSAHFKRDPSRRALIARPDLTTVQLAAEDDFVVLASDGVWDVLPNSEAVAATRRALASTRDAGAAARALVERAQRRASSDNISVITLLLHGRGISLPKSNSMLFKRAQLSSLGAAAAAGAAAGSDSPRSYSSTAPCSGTSTPLSAMTPRSLTPVLGTPAREGPAGTGAGAGAANGGGSGGASASSSPVPVGRC